MTTPLEKLGKDLATAVRPGPSVERRARQRARLLARDWDTKGHFWRWVWAVPVVATAVVVLLLVRARLERTTGAAVEIAADETLMQGRWVSVPNDHAIKL